MSGTGENLDGSRPLGFGEVYIGGKRVQVTHNGTHDRAQSRIGACVEAGACSGGNSIGRGRSVNSHNCLETNGTFFPGGPFMDESSTLAKERSGRQTARHLLRSFVKCQQDHPVEWVPRGQRVPCAKPSNCHADATQSKQGRYGGGMRSA